MVMTAATEVEEAKARGGRAARMEYWSLRERGSLREREDVHKAPGSSCENGILVWVTEGVPDD